MKEKALLGFEVHRMYGRKVDDPGTKVKAGVGLIIKETGGKILLEKRRDSGMWGLPGGGIEPGENVIGAAVREAKEETGLNIQTGDIVGVYSEPGEGRVVTYEDNGDIRHLVDIVLAAEIISGEIEMSEESLDLRFFHPDDFPRDIAPPAVQPLKDFVTGIRGVIR